MKPKWVQYKLKAWMKKQMNESETDKISRFNHFKVNNRLPNYKTVGIENCVINTGCDCGRSWMVLEILFFGQNLFSFTPIVSTTWTCTWKHVLVKKIDQRRRNYFLSETLWNNQTDLKNRHLTFRVGMLSKHFLLQKRFCSFQTDQQSHLFKPSTLQSCNFN